jgi:hypothetical protein
MVGRLTTELHADCANCIGLCCVALPFAASADFAIDKPAGTPCRHLRSDFRCEIHEHLRDSGFRGCAVFDCFGAGQRVTARFGRWSRRAFDAFTATRQLHELLWYLHEALGWDTELRPQLRDALARTEALAHTADPDVAAHRAGVAPLLRAASRSVRGAGAPDRSDADLAGTDLRSASIANSDFRNACLIGANLRKVTLNRVDLLGADLRDTDLRDADLRGALYLTQPQVSAARGNAATRLPDRLRRPSRW